MLSTRHGEVVSADVLECNGDRLRTGHPGYSHPPVRRGVRHPRMVRPSACCNPVQQPLSVNQSSITRTVPRSQEKARCVRQRSSEHYRATEPTWESFVSSACTSADFEQRHGKPIGRSPPSRTVNFAPAAGRHLTPRAAALAANACSCARSLRSEHWRPATASRRAFGALTVGRS
jgi:hypothetical protein